MRFFSPRLFRFTAAGARRKWGLLLLAGALLLSGCAAGGGGGPHAKGEPMELAVGDVLDTASGEVITVDELAEKLSGADVIYVGETHTSREDHRVQLAVLRRIHEKNPCVVVGMEMFPREAQPVLDRYVRGEITEEEFLKESQWDEIWGFPFELYRAIIDYARDNRLRVIGLNAPGTVVRAISRGGFESLSPEERARVAGEFHLDDKKTRSRLLKEFNAHGRGHIKDFESFLAAQLAWEETMAETITGALAESGGKCKIVVIVGKGHLTDGLGVPYFAALRTPHQYRTVAPVPFNYPHNAFDPNLAQFVLLTDAEPPHPPRLGILIKPADSGTGVEVIDILPGSPAEKADLRPGDIIVEVDGTPTKGAADVQKALARGGPEHKISIEREKRKIILDAVIPRP